MLRARLILGLLSLLIILLMIGVYSLQSTSQLEEAISHLLADNYPSIRATQRIKLTCARLNSAVVLKLAREDQEAMRVYRENVKVLKENLEIQARHSVSPKEKMLTEKLRKEVQVFLSNSPPFFAIPAQQDSIPQKYVAGLGPELIGIANAADDILMFQQDVMQTKKIQSKAQIKETTRVLFSAMIMAVVIFIYASYRLGRGILQPIQSLTTSIRQIGQGNLDQTVPIPSSDELGQLAESFNQMAGRLRVYRDNTSEELLHLHRTIQTTLSAFPDPIFILGSELNIELRNPSAEKFDLALLRDRQLHLPSNVHQLVEDTLKTGDDYIAVSFKETISFRIENKENFYLPRILLLRDKEKVVFGVAIILEDVTNLRLLDNLKTDLISTVSHELKTPLTSIRLATHLLLEQDVGTINPKQNELLVAAKEDSDRLLHALNNLLDLSRMEEGGPDLFLEVCTAKDLVETAIQQTREIAEAQRLKISMQIDSPLRPLKVDRQRLGHVFTNLITNAIKHSPENGKIAVRAKRHGTKHVRVSVIDQGMGISTEHHQRIFEKFYRVPGQLKTGAGLGLSIAREITHWHGGNISVISELGKGSEFCVDLLAFHGDNGEVATHS